MKNVYCKKGKKSSAGSGLIGAGNGTNPPMASFLLDDPNASHFGTRLRTFLLKNSPPDCFLNRKNPLRVRVPNHSKEKRTKPKRV